MSEATRQFDLTLGLPHTNWRGLWEPLLLMHAGHFHWQSIAETIGRPLSTLVTRSGSAVYAAFYFIEGIFPDEAPIESFGLDDTLRFSVALRAFKSLTIEGQLHFNRVGAMSPERGDAVRHPYLRFANIFITPQATNRELKIVAPVGADLSAWPTLPNDENPYHLTRAARDSGTLGLFDRDWSQSGEPFDHSYVIDGDRDTNGAGLVYFANYITFAEAGERAWALATGAARHRSVRHRRTAYFGNAEPGDRLRIRTLPFALAGRDDRMGARITIEREEDRRLICISEVIKAIAPAP
jgi:probable biosynthetic protein (TIGR04098 family)